jgi:N-acylneuraminate cytidylyltransferase
VTQPEENGPSLAIIPARGGSKRIPRKNIRPFRGKPILAWSVEAALKSGAFEEVMVSTDDAEIAETARALGAEVPFLRSAQTSDDKATTADVLSEVLGAYAGQGREFSFACCLYPTAPFVAPGDLSAGKAALFDGPFDMIMPVAPFTYPIWRSLRREATGHIMFNFPEYRNSRSQDLSPAYHDAGQWYWFRVGAFLREGTLMGCNAGCVILSPAEVQDIDTEEDWLIAEMKHERMFG